MHVANEIDRHFYVSVLTQPDLQHATLTAMADQWPSRAAVYQAMEGGATFHRYDEVCSGKGAKGFIPCSPISARPFHS